MAHLSSIYKLFPDFWEKAPTKKVQHAKQLALPLVTLLVAIWMYNCNAILCHGVFVSFKGAMAAAIFILTWNMRPSEGIAYASIIGAGLLAVSILEFLHMFTYPGMAVFPHINAPNISLQFWISAGFIEGATLLMASIFVRHKINNTLLSFFSICCCLLIFASVMWWPIFPTIYQAGKGYTSYKTWCDLGVIALLLASAVSLYRNRRFFEAVVRQFLATAIWVAITSDLLASFNADVGGLLSVVTHYLSLISIVLVYLAIAQLDKSRNISNKCVLSAATGCVSHWDVRKKPVKDSHGDIAGAQSLARDISGFKQREFELQQSKAMLQAFLNGISDPMMMVDNNLHVIYSNKAATTVYALDKYVGPPHICSSKILYNGKGRCKTCSVKEIMASKTPAGFELDRPESHRVDKVYVYPFSDKATGLTGAVVRVADVTEAKALERHLIHSEKMNALGLLVAGMVHEINNPNSFISFNLPILRAYLDKILRTLDSHPATVTHRDWFGMDYQAFRREVFALTDNLSHGSSRIDAIISNLKAMTHPKPTPTRKKWVDLSDVLDKAVLLCRSEIRKRIKVFKVFPTPDAVQVKTDPEALEQVIINLLINASHAADKRDSWLHIRADAGKEPANHVIIEVSDNGCGMDKETLDRIFDPFFTTKGPGVGTGLGLAVSYSMVHQLGGEILVESEPEKGTRFRVVLPRLVDAGPNVKDWKSVDVNTESFERIVRGKGI